MNKLHIALLIIAGLMLVKCEEVATFAEYDKEQSGMADSAAAPAETEGSAVAGNAEETTTETQNDANEVNEGVSADTPTDEAGNQQIEEVAEPQNDEAGNQQIEEVAEPQNDEAGSQPTEEAGSQQTEESAKETTSSPATAANTKEEKNEDMAAETNEMYQQSNLATKHAQSMADLKNKLLTIRELYASKRAADKYSAAQAQAAALTGVEKEFQHHSAPVKDFPLPSQMPMEPMLLRRYKQLQRFDAPLPVEPMPSLYFNRPGKPEKYGNYLEADSDHTLYPQQYYPAQPSVIERRRFADKFEQVKSTIPNYALIDQLNVNAIKQGMVY